MEIQKCRERTSPDGVGLLDEGLLPNLDGELAGAAVFGSVLASDFHLQDLVSLVPSLHSGVSHESDQPSLQGAEPAFDFAFGLGRGNNEMGDTESLQSPLELTLWIGVVVAGAGTKEAESIGVDGQRQPVSLEGGAEVREVIPSGVGADKTSCDIEAGMVINSEQ